MKAVWYIHGQGGSVKDAERFAASCEGYDVIGLEYHSELPWYAIGEFRAAYDEICGKYEEIVLVCESLGAYFSLLSFEDRFTGKAFLLSPVADMYRLILDMMSWSGITEEELYEKGTITAPSGQVFTTEYLTFAKEHPLMRRGETYILYGGKDTLIRRESVEALAKRIGAELTVMEAGEHWFHTEEQLAFLNDWMKKRV